MTEKMKVGDAVALLGYANLAKATVVKVTASGRFSVDKYGLEFNPSGSQRGARFSLVTARAKPWSDEHQAIMDCQERRTRADKAGEEIALRLAQARNRRTDAFTEEDVAALESIAATLLARLEAKLGREPSGNPG